MTKVIRIFALLMIPITFACVLFREEVVSVAFERGSFDKASVVMTAGAFACYSIGIFFLACNALMSNVFFGAGDTKTAMYINIANMVINVVLNLVLVYFLGINGLAIATSLSTCAVFFIRVKLIRKYVKMPWSSIFGKLLKVILASAIACGLAKLGICAVSLNRYIELLMAAVIGIAVYLIECHFFKIDEWKDLVELLKKKLKKPDKGEEKE